MSVATSASTPTAGSASTPAAGSGPSTGPRGPKQGRGRVVPAKNKALEEKRYGKALSFSNLDLAVTANGSAHHTDKYQQESLFVRRGQPFNFRLTFQQNIRMEQDEIVLQFSTGPRPQESKGSLIRVTVNFDKKTTAKNGWTVQILDVSGKTVKLEMNSVADSNIGKYDIYVETKLKDDKEFSRVDTKSHFYMLFNAWNKYDEVYMERGDERNEYVMNVDGAIWVGKASRPKRRSWNFGQFEDPVVNVAIGLLDKGELGDGVRNSAGSIIRCISSLVNSMDNNGVLTGRWYDDYRDGTSPSSWLGSVPILKQYNETGLPVKYGQCWVFSALSTSLLRALGIPTRSVTNFSSAHDTDRSMTIDYHVDWNGEPISGLRDDSVWNFHVWNESWFKRNDLPPGYDGWQAHDATPQETSEGIHRCGPASVRAIKMGHVYLNHDAGFIFAEVNGDRITWRVDDDDSMEIIKVDKYSVGRKISTKAVGTNERHDLTLDYKFGEGSGEAKNARKHVYLRSSRKRDLIKDIKPPVLTLKAIVPEGQGFGKDLVFGIDVTNTTDKTVNIWLRLSLVNITYTGDEKDPKNEIGGSRAIGENKDLEVKAGETKTVTKTSTPKEYEAQMNPNALFRSNVFVIVSATKDIYISREAFEFEKPDLFIQAPPFLPFKDCVTMTFGMTNPTTLKLHNGVFNVEGSFCDNISPVEVGKVILPGETVSVEASIRCHLRGERKLIATFTSDELQGLYEEVELKCLKKDD